MLTAEANLKQLSEPNVSGVVRKDYYVDGTSVTADVYINGQWRTILIGSAGRGGSHLFALDVTDPSQFDGIKLLWDRSFSQLGISTSKALITRLNNGSWALVTGYGYNSSTGTVGLLVLDLATGQPIVNGLEASSSGDNGLGAAEGWDYDRNGNTDWFFAGDLQGNLWKFDLSASNPAQWSVAYSGQPLFRARDSLNNAQPITGGVVLATEPASGQLWAFFGTGRYLEEQDPQLDSEQSWYGIMDGEVLSGRAQLKERTLTNVLHSSGAAARLVSPASANDMAGLRGWYMNLPDDRERIVASPRLIGDALVVTSIIPDSNLCNPQGDGYVMTVDPFSGSRLNIHFFDFTDDAEFTEADGVVQGDEVWVLSGLRFDSMPTEPLFFENQMAVGLADTNVVNLDVNTQLRRGRMSWREVEQ